MRDDFVTGRLQGRRVLVVEDDYFQAQDMAELLQGQGAEVLGPVSNVEAGLALLLRRPLPDLAVLDIRLAREKVFPLADALRTLGIPFAFASASPSWSLPEPYEALPHCEKPVDPPELLRTLALLGGACRPGGPGSRSADASLGLPA